VPYDGVLSDSPDYSINEAAALAVHENVDGVVAVGGGSSIDTGKGVDVLLSNPPPITCILHSPANRPPAICLSLSR
jgi:alcohol dehydrogenase class IV